jgi:AraC-like DNA-binding protein
MPRSNKRDNKQTPRLLLNSFEVRLMVADLVEVQGVDPQEIFTGTGVSPQLMASPSQRLSLQQELALYTRIASCNCDPSLGLRIGQRINLPSYGVLGSAMMSSATVGDALQLLSEFAPMVSWASHSELAPVRWERADCSAFTVYPSVSSSDVSASMLEMESTFASLQILFNELVSGHMHFEAVEMSHPNPGDGLERYEALFQCPVLFSRPRNRLIVSRATLRQSLPHPQPEFEHLFKDLCRQATLILQEDRGLVAAVKSRLLFEDGSVPDLENMAAQFNVSARSLRRQLATVGLSFRGLLEEARYREARRYLQSTPLTVAVIASRLGYADARSFRTAFKRWAGQTPADFRQALPRQAKR